PFHLIESFEQNRGAADDLVEIVFGPYFLLQVDVFRSELILKRLHFRQRNAQFSFGPLPVELRARTGSECFQNWQAVGTFTHGLIVHHNKIAEHFAGGSHYRNSQVADGSKLGKALVEGEDPLKIPRVVASIAFDHFLTGRVQDVVLEIISKPIALPKSQRTNLRSFYGVALRDKCVSNLKSRSDGPHERSEEINARDGRRSLYDRLNRLFRALTLGDVIDHHHRIFENPSGASYRRAGGAPPNVITAFCSIAFFNSEVLP